MDYVQELNRAKDWAKNLLILEYSQAPRNRQFIDLMCDILYANNLVSKIRDYFNLGYTKVDLSRSQGVTNAVINYHTFSQIVNNTSGDYIFKYNNGNWTLNGETVTLSDYGIVITGTPQPNDVLNITFVEYTAEGAQLDIIGKWVGIDRYYDAIDLWEQPYTALVNYSNVSTDTYDDMQGGFSTFSNFEDNDGGFLTYLAWINTRTKVNQMGDDYLRRLIKLKIIKNNINHSMKAIDDAIWQWSGGEIYTTWNKMEVTYHYPTKLSNLMLLAQYKDVLVAPTGCEIKTEVIS